MTILGPKLVSSEGRDGFLGNTIDSIFWQVSGHVFKCDFSQLSVTSRIDLSRSTGCFAKWECLCKGYWDQSCCVDGRKALTVNELQLNAQKHPVICATCLRAF